MDDDKQEKRDSLARMLSHIFGPESSGSTSEERARTSSRLFVRSQDHVGLYRNKGKGRVLSAFEALKAFGYRKLYEAVETDAAVLPSTRKEPSSTLARRRQELGLSVEDVALSSSLSPQEVTDAEDPSKSSPIRILEVIAQHLGLDESAISVKSGAGGDDLLAVRLRTYAVEKPDFSRAVVRALSEAAWIVMTETRLRRWLGETRDLVALFEHSSNFGTPGYPAWQQGYWLAGETRRILGLGVRPVPSLRRLCEELVIPVVQMELPSELAGAAIESGGHRGIVVNTLGRNRNVWVRRATLAHELGHLLWDPTSNLQSLRVDEYESLEAPPWSGGHDVVEARANAFAIEFLAPQAAAIETFLANREAPDSLRHVMVEFGVSFTAASYHVWNALNRIVERDSLGISDVEASPEWKAAEDWTLDWFPLRETSAPRRGSFSNAVVRAHQAGLISSDTAASYLETSADMFESKLSALYELAG